MELTGHIRRAMLRERARPPLDLEDACRLWAALLDGALDDVEVGAVVAALAVAGETGAELAGLQRAAQARLARWGAASCDGLVSIPAYGRFAGEAAIVALAAALLRRFDLRVIVHGVLDAPCGVSCASVLRELGVMPCASLQQAEADVATHAIAFVPMQLVSPAFARLLALRSHLGIENCAHRVAQLLDPTHGQALRVLLDVAGACGAMDEDPALLLTWAGAQPPCTFALRPRIERVQGARRERLFEADSQELAAPPLPDDAARLAAIVRDITTGRAPVPVAALNLVAACLYASGRAPDLARAKAAAAVAGGRLAA